MSQLTRDEIRVAASYEAERDAARRHLAALKRHRRIILGDRIAVVFENHETLRGVVEEVVRSEHLIDDEAVNSEVAAVNAVVPAAGELCAFVYLEVIEAADLAAATRQLSGVERAINLEVGGAQVAVSLETVSLERGDPAVHHLRFVPSAEQLRQWRGNAEVVLVSDHPECTARAVLSDEQSQALLADLDA